MKLPSPMFAALLTTAVLAAGPPHVAAQVGPSLQELAIEWVRGRFGSPLICQIEGQPVRGMRRLHVTLGPRHARPPVARMIFVGLELEDATRCFTDLEKSVPDVTGSLQIRFPGAERRDTSSRDFKAILRREGGLEFEIVSGVLRLREVGAPSDEKREVDFRAGKARFLSVRPGTDVDRMLSGFDSPRKRDLVITARDGTTLKFALFLAEAR